MLFVGKIDVNEENIKKYEIALLKVLLFDRTSRRNIIWATDNYSSLGEEYKAEAPILPNLITGENFQLIQPRIAKTMLEQDARTKEKAEVFTPCWICNEQNNLVDEQWFERKNVFNTPLGSSWSSTPDKIVFPNKTGKSWRKYVDAKRLEISCGEAPYLVSRYDAVSGKEIPVSERIGLLDRKLRVVNENTESEEDWKVWAIRAFQAIYGYEFQGDNLLLARENLLITYIDYYQDRFAKAPHKDDLLNIARVISWNIWQMDGLKYVIPYSCKAVEKNQISMFGDEKNSPCPACSQGNIRGHTGKYCRIYDWREKESRTFISLMKGEA